ncbi:gliding motility-associated ABC transporter substrate-binding protein GldG [Fulvivirga lutimaris]|uniref:gliding motility-associated ABC transporter substrate-binding protein GldG n=1 Tax=Fulvivirga lutimaris TaxID=1819566 RepID=UPI0012BB50E7|nr:gliding motility-associated ABC transporter substrate-binding protein GldG [Fulvivirga lutimaris]MTI41231.1 gliding motility-associated ABC transporter substrate-binding protein GldG [Fulvivirga lutimaris]
MVKLDSAKLEDILKLLIGLVLIIWINLLASSYFGRIDLTEEKRYTIKPATKKLLSDLDDVVTIEVYLEGELNASFERMQKSIKETLEEFRIYSDNKLQYSFVDPSSALNEQARGEFMQGLMARGIQPTNVIDKRDGNRVEKLIFPGAIVSYGGVEQGVMLLGGNKAASSEEKINQSIEGIEYNLASTIHGLTSIERKSVGVIRGHGELDEVEMASLLTSLDANYNLSFIDVNKPLPSVGAVLLAKPTSSFTEIEKYNLDQYLMNGGKLFMLLDKLQANMDSASSVSNYSFPYNLNLDDMLFKYGIRINNDLIQDNSASNYPVNVGNFGDQPQIKMIKWWFYPIINRYGDHVITRNMDAVIGKFVSTIDTVKADGVKKTPLMFTSEYSRSMTAPVNVSLQDLRKTLTPEMLNEANLPVAYLMEGEFTSLYKNRFKPEGVNDQQFKDQSDTDAKIVIVSDGDIAKNDVNPRTGSPQPLGFDPFSGVDYANQEFILNTLNYLVDDEGLITARNKQIKIRPLDKVKIGNEKTKWQMINLVLPIILLIGYGVIRFYLRKRKYTGFKTD